MPSEGWESTCAHLEVLVEGDTGLRDFSKVLEGSSTRAHQIVRGMPLPPEAPDVRAAARGRTSIGQGVEKHSERSIDSGELQIDDSVEDIVVKETHMREPAKIGKRGHFGSSFMTAMELIMNIPKFIIIIKLVNEAFSLPCGRSPWLQATDRTSYNL